MIRFVVVDCGGGGVVAVLKVFLQTRDSVCSILSMFIIVQFRFIYFISVVVVDGTVVVVRITLTSQ